MVVHADVGDMRGHALDRVAPSNFQKPLLAGRVELQQGRAELEALRPFRPAARGVFAYHGENRRAGFRFPRLFKPQDFLRRKLEQSPDFGNELLRCELVVDLYSHILSS